MLKHVDNSSASMHALHGRFSVTEKVFVICVLFCINIVLVSNKVVSVSMAVYVT